MEIYERAARMSDNVTMSVIGSRGLGWKNSDRIGRVRNAARSIPEQGATDSLPLPITIHGQTRQHGYRDGIRHVPPEPSGSAFHGDGARSPGIIADHALSSQTT